MEECRKSQESENIGVSMNINDGLPLLSESIKKCTAGMSCWGMTDLTLGLYKLYQHHLQESVIDTISGSQVQDIKELGEMSYWLKWAIASYKEDRRSIAECLQINELQIKKHVRTSAVLRPSYFIAVDDVKLCLVIAIRGTQSTTDIITDLNPHSEKFEKGYAHSGILAAAKWLMGEESENLQILMKAYPGHKLVLTGHSLGAGTASLLCMLLQEAFSKDEKNPGTRLIVPNSMFACWSFGCPPCVDEKLSQEQASIRNIILQDDLIARLSPAALEDLRSEIPKTDWPQTLTTNDKIKKVVELAQVTSGVVKDIEATLGYEHGHFYKQIKSFSFSSLSATKEIIKTRLAEGQQPTDSSNDRTVSKWLSFGASTVIRCAERFSAPSINCEQMGTRVAATVVANSAAREDTSNSSLCDVRLYVPGILYHVIRKDNARNVQHLSSNNQLLGSNNLEEFREKEIADEELASSPRSVGKCEDINQSVFENDSSMQYTVTRGDDPAFRFKRIVLSNSMLYDHGCQSYESALKGAVNAARKNRKP
ncbi:hypothetical protein SUGI_0881060 [Cryptomeria japonica]|uniref:uncharacterized protein LOC131071266 n=1 Tax=Cryptomeria japonica TaxID=3369 RepID=UPI002414A71F|nr:uncharacterized protein LOC131071266 [Cryptomeria japonica]XP_057863019.1 uncharacterized protein LOC131071266 [Cryptomeria japonica]GLJ42506.1 hypothetical protein SUGI_0881060 [Cryptomeria japonica]